MEERNAKPHNDETKKEDWLMIAQHQGRSFTPALGDGDNGGDHRYGNEVEIERMEESLKKEERSL